MKPKSKKSPKLWRFIGLALLLPVLIIGILLFVLFLKQDDIIQGQIAAMNKLHKGRVTVGATHLSPFENFPYVSIKVDDVGVYETKEEGGPVILEVADIYIGFDIWDIVSGNYDIQTLVIEDGVFNFVLHEDGTNNLENALASDEETEETEPLGIHLKNIKVRNLDIHKLNESNNMDFETYVYSGDGAFRSGDGQTAAHIDTEFELNIMDGGDTTFINHKHFEFHVDFVLDDTSGMLTLKPSGIVMEHGDFRLEGSVDTKNDMDLDLSVSGTKPNFDMLIAFAPADLIPVLERYDNAGNIYFNAVIQGPTTDNRTPFIDAKFGASEAFLENTEKGKRVDEMGFEGHFTNGENRDFNTMEFSLTDVTAQLEKGKFYGSVVVNNFDEPEIDMQLKADFNLDFLIGFFNVSDIDSASGNVVMEMKFHDIIDLEKPEHALTELNRAYSFELKVEDLSLASENFPAPMTNLDMHMIMTGKRAVLDQFDMQMGQSDLSMTGYITDLPAIVHHTAIPVETHLEIQSKVLDIAELSGHTKNDTVGVDERMEDLSGGFSFKSSAKALTESKYLPIGEFFIDSLHAQLKHYPHELHDFHVDFLIDDRDLKIVDFTGYIDDSDFHFNGLVHDYGFWMQKELKGDVDLDITLSSNLLRLEDIFSYGGENYVPEDYRHEEVDKLVLHANTSMHYRDSVLHSIDIDLDKFNAKMHVHPLRVKDFAGHFHYEDDHLVIQDFHGQMGKTVFDANMNYYLGDDTTVMKRDNYLQLKANYIDFDQLSNFNMPSSKSSSEAATSTATTQTIADVEEHATAFNLYELPFTAMEIDLDVKHFIYHRIDLQHIDAHLRTTPNHFLFIDTLHMDAAGGSLALSGYFNGSDPQHIYVKPDLVVENMNLDELLFKFENFGQDHLVSENLHGQISTRIQGKIRVYPDLVPDLDQSEIHMDVEVLNGRLENYEPMLMLSDYMGSKDLNNIRFDTLQNHMDITNGTLTIPNMVIESTLGHMEVSGTQDMDYNMEYYVRIPWKTIRQGARNKLFGNKKTSDGETGDDEILEVDPNEKIRYLNLRIFGNMDDFKVRTGKKN